MKVLHLTLKKKWFDMIASGEKTEEYREIKPYWFRRLAMCSGKSPIPHGYTCKKAFCSSCVYGGGFVEKPYSIVKFRHGYSKNAPTLTFRMNEIRVTTGFHEWGAEPGKKYFVIKLGERL
jgi:hypothetical protein